MTRFRSLTLALVTIGLATVMHLDWHAARPTEHHLSLGWQWHWVLAIPVFLLTAWYVVRAWPERTLLASIAILGIATVLAAVVEPAWEYWTGATFEWAFGRQRLGAFGAFLAAGASAHCSAVALAGKRRVNRGAGAAR